MNVSIEELSPCRRKLRIEVPAEEVSGEYQQAIAAYKKNAKIPGFRPGRAPAHLVKARYNSEILSALRDRLVPKSYHEAVEKEQLKVAQIVGMDEEVTVAPEQPLAFEITVDLVPKLELPAYQGMTLVRQAVEVGDGDVENTLTKIRERSATYEAVEGRPVVAGDIVQIDFTATLNGQPLSEIEGAPEGLGEAKGFWVQADENAFVPEIGAALPGLSVGEDTTVRAHFADTFDVAALQNQDVDYAVTVLGIRARKLPELDAAFLERLGVESEEALRSQIRSDLASEGRAREDARLRREIEKFLLENTKADLPESVVASEAARQVRQIVQNASRNGMSTEDFEQNREAILGQANQGAAETVKLRYILSAVAEEQGITVSSTEVQNELRTMAYGYGMQVRDLEKRMQQNEAMGEFRRDVLVRKTLKWIFDQAKIED